VRQRFLECCGQLAGIGDASALDAERGGDLGVISFEVYREIRLSLTSR
jgi:hypothetical protein